MASKRLFGAVAAALLILVSSPAHSLPTAPGFICTASGSVSISLGSNGVVSWKVAGTGTCVDLSNPVPMCTDRYGNPCAGPGPKPAFTLTGTGTSTRSGGACGRSVVENVLIDASLNVPEYWSDPFFSESGWVLKPVQQRWIARVAVVPGSAAFRITNPKSGTTSGAGAILDAIATTCSPQHTAARFQLVFG